MLTQSTCEKHSYDLRGTSEVSPKVFPIQWVRGFSLSIQNWSKDAILDEMILRDLSIRFLQFICERQERDGKCAQDSESTSAILNESFDLYEF